jgi:heptosyltransferase I
MMNILIIRLSAIGDAIHVMPSLNLLRKYFPKDHISWVICKKALDLIDNDPLIDKVYSISDSFPKSILYDYQTIRELSKIDWDIIIDYHNIVKSLVLRLFLRGPVYTYCYEDCYLLEEKISYYLSTYTANKIDSNNIIHKNLLLTEYIIKNTLKLDSLDKLYYKYINNYSIESKKYVDSWLLSNNLDNFIIFSPNTSRDIKKINKQIWIDLFNYFSTHIDIVILGYHLDIYTKELADNLNKNNKLFIFDSSKINDAKYLLTKSKINICHDSCILHLSNLLEHNTLGIFGPTNSVWYGGNYNNRCKYIQGNTAFIRNKNFTTKNGFSSINSNKIIEIIKQIYI